MEDKDRLVGDQKLPLKTLLKKSLKYMKSVRWHIIFAMLFILINVGLDIILPKLIQLVVDTLKISGTINIKLITIAAIAYFAITLLNQGFRFVEGFLLQKAGNRIVYQLRVDTFEHIEQMSLDQFSVMPTGLLHVYAAILLN